MYDDNAKQFRKKRETFNESGQAHELTFSCYKRLPLLSKERTCLWFLQALDAARKRWDFDLWAYVIMPDHAHILLMPQHRDYQIASILKSIKQPVSQRAMDYLRREQPEYLPQLAGRKRGDKVEHHFWQPGGGFDRNVFEPRTAWKMVDYLHNNPLRKSLALRAVDWRWSSARYYEGLEEYDLAVDGRPPDTL